MELVVEVLYFNEKMRSSKLVRDLGFFVLLVAAVGGFFSLQLSISAGAGLIMVLWVPFLIPLFFGLFLCTARLTTMADKEYLRVQLSPLFMRQICLSDVVSVEVVPCVAFSDNYKRGRDESSRSFAIPFQAGTGVLITTSGRKNCRVRTDRVHELLLAMNVTP